MAMAQESHTIDFSINMVTEYGPNDLYFCDSITCIIVHKNPEYNGTPFWIDQNDVVIHADSIIITASNDGKLVYIEKDNDLLLSINIYIMEDNMPVNMSHGIWLSEGETKTLYPTAQDEGYEYVWESSNWPSDSLYHGYTLDIVEPGFYRCNMWDGCLHYSKVEYFANQDPILDYVTTNLLTNTNEIHWTPYTGCFYDTLNVYRDGQLVGQCEFQDGVWVDPTVNNADSAHRYSVEAVKNGESLVGQTSWKSGISLQTTISGEMINISFSEPGDGNEIPLTSRILFYQLYSIEDDGWWLVRSMIPIGTTELQEMNIFDTLVVAGVLIDGSEIYSNLVIPSALSGCNEYSPENITIYPNPTTDILNISGNINAEYTIFNIQGELIMNGTINNSTSTLDVSSFAKGLYIIKIVKGNKEFVKKFVVE